MILESFHENLHVAVIGASGGIGQAFVQHFVNSEKVEKVYCFSRSKTENNSDKIVTHAIDFLDENSVERAANSIPDNLKLDIIIVATGLLHDGDTQPEKSLKDLNFKKFEDVFAVNTYGPALVMKHFLPRIHKEQKSVFAALSARVGSISDNGIGGWYAYRASKAALNMLIKNASIEIGRRYKHASIIGLHPGTVDTGLSEPFQGHVPNNKLFTPDYSTKKMLEVVDQIDVSHTGKIFDYAGEEVKP